ncbi:hypothetical protein KVT40_004279 [Elsinoe batatas]|uniref:Uncharacterized protein n=1 Tax=Elsinoe batatas TaxID=2601811 RepID=A0A8K0L1Y7_9PEZI|nr:hypothetical protein KVT40_004279 [Elsinoe batatas]
MATDGADARVQRLAEGFHSLLDEYNTLLARSRAFERSIQDAKSQFERFVTEKGTVSKQDVQTFTFAPVTRDIEDPLRRQTSKDKWWMRSDLPMSKRNLLRTRYAVDSVHQLGLDKQTGDDANSKISSDMLANNSSAMPSIFESPLEQDFTVPGTPSRLDCPFASMANRRLSAHARSVVSRYRQPGTHTPRSSNSQAIARSSTPMTTQPPSSLKEPGDEGEYEPEQCALPRPRKDTNEIEASLQGSGPTCPIRFLEKSSPEEVAEYFEKHKHELPRSHEVCVKRYQSNEESIRQLDAKYGNLVSMIQGLGQKHAPMLPDTKGDDEVDVEGEQDAESAERVRRWASDVSNVKVQGQPSDEPEAQVEADAEERQGRFDRPLKDVRVGESPSRPWGIPVPLEAIERAEGKVQEDTTVKPAAKCPFSRGAPPGMPNPHEEKRLVQEVKEQTKDSRPVFIKPGDSSKVPTTPGMTFTGPVFIGYSPEQAVAVLQALKGAIGSS